MVNMRVLITGGAGFIGTWLACRLLQDGHAVVVFDNLLAQVHGDPPHPNVPSGCEPVWADVRDVQAVKQAMRNVEVVHHLAGATGVGQSQYQIARYISSNTY